MRATADAECSRTNFLDIIYTIVYNSVYNINKMKKESQHDIEGT